MALGAMEGVLRAIDFSFSFAPERVEFGWPNPRYLTKRFERDPDVFWVTKDYSTRLEQPSGFALIPAPAKISGARADSS